MTASSTPIPMSPPGEHLRRELEAQDLRQEDLAEIMGRPLKAINALVRGQKQITPETALQLADALEVPAEHWLNLEQNYRLYLAREKHSATPVALKRKLYDFAPVREMVKRGWIDDGDDVQGLEENVLDFFGIDSLDKPLPHMAAYRATSAPTIDRHSRIAWICQAKHLASRQPNVATFDADLDVARLVREELRPLVQHPEAVSEVPSVLANAGIHFVVLPSLPRTRVDGALVMLQSGNPVIAMSLRYGTLDGFWFTLFHECAHIDLGHQESFDDFSDVEGMAADDEEAANDRARDWLIPDDLFSSFVSSNTGTYSKPAVESFAARAGVHPAVVVGRLKHEGRIPWSVHRPLQVSIKPHLLESDL